MSECGGLDKWDCYRLTREPLRLTAAVPKTLKIETKKQDEVGDI